MQLQHCSIAQSKIGAVNTEELMKRMHEVSVSDSVLQEYQDSIANELGKRQQAFDAKYIFSGCSEGKPLSAQQKESKRNEVIKDYTKLDSLQRYNQHVVYLKAEKLRAAIIVKLTTLVKKTAEENGYCYVLDLCGDSKLPLPPCDDITGLVIAKLDQ